LVSEKLPLSDVSVVVIEYASAGPVAMTHVYSEIVHTDGLNIGVCAPGGVFRSPKCHQRSGVVKRHIPEGLPSSYQSQSPIG